MDTASCWMCINQNVPDLGCLLDYCEENCGKNCHKTWICLQAARHVILGRCVLPRPRCKGSHANWKWTTSSKHKFQSQIMFDIGWQMWQGVKREDIHRFWCDDRLHGFSGSIWTATSRCESLHSFCLSSRYCWYQWCRWGRESCQGFRAHGVHAHRIHYEKFSTK